MNCNSCATVMPSKQWPRKKEDPTAPKQAYYCHTGHKYNANWGQLIEMRTLTGKLLYAIAEVPGHHIQDIRALKIERECPNMTAEQIFDSLPIIPPQTTPGFITVNEAANEGLEQPKFFNIKCRTLLKGRLRQHV